MSTFYYPVTVYSPDRSKAIEVELLVDTGSTFTWIPRHVLEQLGYRPTYKRQFEIGDGKIIEGEVTEAIVGLDGNVGSTRVCFSGPGEPPSLGAVTLEEFLLAADPVHQKLVPVRGLRI